jgi:AraC-like DNA-binding protein
VAERCGFGTATALRGHFRRVVGTTPTAYRRTFGPEGEVVSLHAADRRPPARTRPRGDDVAS